MLHTRRDLEQQQIGRLEQRETGGSLDGWILIIIAAMRVVFQFDGSILPTD
jgi:hypothetical protein